MKDYRKYKIFVIYIVVLFLYNIMWIMLGNDSGNLADLYNGIGFNSGANVSNATNGYLTIVYLFFSFKDAENYFSGEQIYFYTRKKNRFYIFKSLLLKNIQNILYLEITRISLYIIIFVVMKNECPVISIRFWKAILIFAIYWLILFLFQQSIEIIFNAMLAFFVSVLVYLVPLYIADVLFVKDVSLDNKAYLITNLIMLKRVEYFCISQSMICIIFIMLIVLCGFLLYKAIQKKDVI